MFNHLEIFFESLWRQLLSNGHRYYSGKHIYLSDLIGLISTNPLSWDPWELDSKFFDAMSQWTIDHPETTLDRVLDNICIGIDAGKDLLDLIPDNPFPARSLVKALGCLIKLGVVRHCDRCATTCQ
jgi:hypothetical protein